MTQLTASDLMSLEQYARERADFRAKVLEHKKTRQVALGPNATLYFEDELTIRYQVQEMLRIERIFEAEGIEDELSAYNPLIPDGSNWKATFMLEYPDIEVRKRELGKLIGVEDKVWVQVDGHDKVYAIADEDLERDTDEKTSSVHFMRFELDDDMVQALKGGVGLAMGVDHDNLSVTVTVPDGVRASLVNDLS
ncbi:DUF3501 family protein [Thioalkalivibrio sp. XN279]|uniref:DUF3501 family protein n=1 Tax=Thioalkalivibrio sp. XN279 TaxID=2714953 RepID=UPI00140956F2|nr:DUF3501 family protein [Thioalkalivibrio sp. XN279]NHA15540.1 DUF3501 family protein [Thioalkalivibrio sp. XN279]